MKLKVIKRNGDIVDFNKNKIKVAILKAMKSVAINNEKVADEISQDIESIAKLKNNELTIKQIEDYVFNELVQKGFKEVAKSYEGYRAVQEFKRNVNTTDESILGLVDFTNEEVITENANKQSALASTQRDLVAGEISKDISKRKLIPANIVQAHNEGIIKLHDLDYFLQPITNCELVPLDELFSNGTVINKKMIKTPKSLRTAATLMTQIALQISSLTFGGQTMSLSHLAPYVRVSYEKIKKELIEEDKKIGIYRTDEQIKIIVDKRLHKEIKDSVQTINYQLLSMNSTNGQSPFISLCMYIDEDEEYAEETAMLIEEFLKQRIEGIENQYGVKSTQTFPKLLFFLDENNMYPNSKYYYLKQLAIKATAIRMNPDYISVKKMKEIYGYAFPCMGCLDGQEIITYKIKDSLYVESFERMWDRLSKLFEVKEQIVKGNYYIDLKNVTIYDTQNGFVNCQRIIKNKDKGDWCRVKFSNGRSILATSDHPLPIKNKGRIFVKDLHIGDLVTISQQQYSENKINYNIDKAWLLGFILCDGSYSNGKVTSSIALESENDIEENYKRVMKQIYNIDTRTIERHRGKKGDYKDLITTQKDKYIREEFEVLFEGKQKIVRHIPNEVFVWNKEAKLSFLAGMLDADGYVNSYTNGSIIQLGSTNKELALQTMALAQSLGYQSKMYLNHYDSSNKNKIRYRIEFTATIDLLQYSHCEKKIKHFVKESNIGKTNESCVIGVKFIGNMDKYSYDVTTDSDYFEVSGIYSHNCRSFLFPWKNEKGEPQFYGRGNLGVTTINLPDIALSSHKDINKFWEIFENRMENLVKPSLMLRYTKLEGVKAKVAPLLWCHGVFSRLDEEDYIQPVVKDKFSLSIGYAGLYETVKYMTDEGQTEEKGFKLAKEIMQYLHDKAEQWKKETGLGFSIYGTPIESTTEFFSNSLKNRFGEIKDITDKGWITNSYHVDIRQPIDAFSKLKIESELQKLSTGGNVSYVEVYNMEKNLEALEQVIDFMYENNIYAEINSESDVCGVCHYTGTMDNDPETLEWVCPQCGNRDQNKLSVVRRTCGYLGETTWTKGRKLDILNRVKHL